MGRGLLWVAVLTLGLLEAGCLVTGPRCGRGRVYRGGMCVCPSPYAWSAYRRMCVRPGVVVAPAPARGVVCGGGRVYAGGRCVCPSPYAWNMNLRRCVRPRVVTPRPRAGYGPPRYRPGARPVPNVRVRPTAPPRVRARRVAPRRAACPAPMVFVGGRCVCRSPWIYSQKLRRCVRVTQRPRRARRVIRVR